MDTKTKITSGAIGILTILSLVLGANLINQDNVFVCLEKEIAMVCNSLSKVNANGFQTRCYYEETYKICNSGWVKFEKPVPIKVNYPGVKDFKCDNGMLIKECFAEDGSRILRVGM